MVMIVCSYYRYYYCSTWRGEGPESMQHGEIFNEPESIHFVCYIALPVGWL